MCVRAQQSWPRRLVGNHRAVAGGPCVLLLCLVIMLVIPAFANSASYSPRGKLGAPLTQQMAPYPPLAPR